MISFDVEVCHGPSNELGETFKENITVAAPYWTDIDLSERKTADQNRVYYNIYEASSDVQRTSIVEELVRKTLMSSYVADWTLVVTWSQVLPYAASIYMNTSQVI